MNRFWNKVLKTKTCWLWTAYIEKRGKYGRFGFRGKTVGAHRVAYELIKGKIPTGLTLDHLCKVRHCVNPEHLEPVTLIENIMRGDGFGPFHAQKTHCKNGHPFDELNTKKTKRQRICKTCKYVDSKKRRLRTYIPKIRTKKTQCKRGHEFNKSNTLVAKDGHRSCKKCLDAWKKIYLANLREATRVKNHLSSSSN